MLLKALYDYANRKKLLTGLPFQKRKIHVLVPLKQDGTLRGDGLVPLSTPVKVKDKEKEELGQERLTPRFPGENNGGKAYFLAESVATVFGLRKESGEPLPDTDTGKDRNPVRAFRHFWRRIEDAHERTKDQRLLAILKFRERYLSVPSENWGRKLPFLALRENAKTKKQEFSILTNAATWISVAKANTVSFEVDGDFVFPDDDEDAIWKDWAEVYYREAYADPEDDESTTTSANAGICLVTGQVGLPVARSHKPKIMGIPGLGTGGYVVSFAKEAQAFSSFGFEMGDNAQVAETTAAAYALALNELLSSDDTSFRVGDKEGNAFCFWAENQSIKEVGRYLDRANPKTVVAFLKSPFAGINRDLAKKDFFLSVVLSGNKSRVVVREWLRIPLECAVQNLVAWFEHLSIAALNEEREDDENKGGPYSLFRLAATTVREAKELKRVSVMVGRLYRCALENLPPPVSLLGPVLQEFKSALVKDRPSQPTFPFNRSRFALIKLILSRNPEGGFMPGPHLSDTDDAAYNLGRLMTVFASLQDQAHEYELEGPGVVGKYYGAASAAPATVFPLLIRLHNHHLRKVEQQGEKGLKAASAIRNRIAELLGKFPPGGPGQPPRFPRQLSLEEQGRFALGFYQQKAADLQAIRDFKQKAANEK